MISGWTEEHDELRAVLRRFLADKAPLSAAHAAAEGDATGDAAVWAQMAHQMGLQGLVVPELYGGSGGGPVELGVVMEEMGRALYVGPFYSTVALAAQTLVCIDDEVARRRWLPEIAAGTLTATVAVADDALTFDTATVATTAAESDVVDGAAWTVTGVKEFVVDGATADLILVAARVGEQMGLFAVAGDAPGLQRDPVPTIDFTRAVARVSLDGAAAVRVGGDVTEVLSRAGDLATAALAAEQIGGAGAALDMAVEYAKMRVQFDRPIGTFQAIKHRCADLLVAVESGRSAAFFAAALLAENDPDGALAASVAKAWCSAAYTKASKENIQFHGGIGYTWECDAHLYLRRATASDVNLGAPAVHRRRIAELVEM
ncbi:acyl-CoA dehydrogenase family protein [Mycobacterium sp. E796]|uniref:acyl-CoA dehydrogenase family protein n=1 Tax=Mycobacterium sp. E796 TaxID=1834151 RepID=UPI000A76DFA8|nr:acyl-CoA dehydrogenase family protein [Mycobacterium sp. E796]